MKMYYIPALRKGFWWITEKVIPVETAVEDYAVKVTVNFKIGKYDFTLNKNAIGQSLFSTYEEAMATLIEKNKDAKRRLKNGGEAVAKSDLSPCFGERIFKAD